MKTKTKDQYKHHSLYKWMQVEQLSRELISLITSPCGYCKYDNGKYDLDKNKFNCHECEMKKRKVCNNDDWIDDSYLMAQLVLDYEMMIHIISKIIYEIKDDIGKNGDNK